MISSTVRHLRANAVAYLALFFAISGGGTAAAIAATHDPTIHACVSKRTGAVFIAKRCNRRERVLRLDQRGPVGARGGVGPAGPAGVEAFGQVHDVGTIAYERGLVISSVSPGVFAVTVTAPECTQQNINVVPVVSALSESGDSGTPTAWTEPSDSPGASFDVEVGTLEGASFLPGGQGFDVQVECS